MDLVQLKSERLKPIIFSLDRKPFIVNLIDTTEKIAKKENRESTNDDLILASKQTIKSLEKTIESLNGVDAKDLIQKYNDEIDFCKMFLPVEKSLIEKECDINHFLSTCEDFSNRGLIMKRAKELSLDMKLLNEILQRR